MLQRNDTDYALMVAAEPVTVVEPGETIDRNEYLTGFTPVEPPMAPAPPAPAAKASASKAAPANKPAAEEATA